MSRIARGAALVTALLALFACSDKSRDPVSPPPEKPSRLTVSNDEVWNVADIEADFPGAYSIDDTQEGASATPYIVTDQLTGSKDFCRDHFKPIDMYWESGNGLAMFHLDPPLLLRKMREGTFTSPRGLVFLKAEYETVGSSEATDRDGNVWRFKGRFNALCRGGALELGPIVFSGQIVVAQGPVDKPVLVRSGSGGCGSNQYENDYEPYDYTGSGDYGCSGSGGGGDGGGSDGLTCHSEYVYLEVSYDYGATWEVIWQGYATVCE